MPDRQSSRESPLNEKKCSCERPFRSQFVPWLASILTSLGRGRVRARPQAAMIRGKCHAKEDDMPDNRSRTAKTLPVSVALILFAAFVLSACVQSETLLLAGSKPLLGMQFQLNLYQDFTEGKALSVKTSVFRWNDNHYSLVSVVSLHEEDPQA